MGWGEGGAEGEKAWGPGIYRLKANSVTAAEYDRKRHTDLMLWEVSLLVIDVHLG